MTANRFNFRVWGKKQKCFISGLGYDFDNRTIGFFESGDNGFNEFNNQEDYILMQSTNCVDSHGKEIFEGDIVKETKDSEHYICEVKYDDYLKQFRLYRFKGRQSYLLIDYDSYDEIINDCNNHDRVIGEVIGNVYQNPELLEK